MNKNEKSKLINHYEILCQSYYGKLKIDGISNIEELEHFQDLLISLNINENDLIDIRNNIYIKNNEFTLKVEESFNKLVKLLKDNKLKHKIYDLDILQLYIDELEYINLKYFEESCLLFEYIKNNKHEKFNMYELMV